MTVRTAMPATESTGDVWTTTLIDKLPGGWIGYVEVTANQTGITTIADLTGLSATVTVNTSRRVQVTGYGVFTAGGNVSALASLRESSTTLQQFKLDQSGNGYTYVPIWVGTPSAGSHTYKMSFTSSGTSALSASSTNPAFLLIEDIGPSS